MIFLTENFNLFKKTAVAAGVAGCAGLNNLDQEGIIITIAVYGNDLLKMTACGALIPKLLPASGPKPSIAGFQRFFRDSLFI